MATSAPPQTILISGIRDLLSRDTVRMHRSLQAAGVPADLHVYDGQPHGDCMQALKDAPESSDAQKEIANFFESHLKQEGPSASQLAARTPFGNHPKCAWIPSSTLSVAMDARIRPMTRLMMLAPPSPINLEIHPAPSISP